MHKPFPSGFRALLVAQFLGALNDNIFKLLVIFLVLDQAVTNADASRGTIELIGALFVLPFILFSYWAGYVGDHFSKAKVARVLKGVELGVMLLALLIFSHGHPLWLIMLLFVLGSHSAFFSPAKYGLVPELVAAPEVSRANGVLELLTFVPIILGTIIGGALSELPNSQQWISGAVLVAIAVAGLVASSFITALPPSSLSDDSTSKTKVDAPASPLPTSLPTFGGGAWSSVRELLQTRELRLVSLASCYFWFIAQLFQLNVPRFGRYDLGLTSLETSILLAVLGVGIGVGSVFAGRVSEGKVELGLVPIGSLLIAFGNLGLGYVNAGSTAVVNGPTHSSYLLTLIWLALVGLGGGFFIVPLNSYLQSNSPPAKRASYIASTNLLVYTGMLGSSLISWVVLEVIGVNSSRLFLFTGAVAVLVTVYVCTVLPQLAIRCINWIVTHTLYRISVFGRENVPTTGGALVVCNHVAYSDPPLLLATIDRNVSFLMFKPIYDLPGINWIARIMHAIPISVAAGPKAVVESLRRAAEEIRNGRLAGIFAEGQLTRLGTMVRFGHGLERIMKGVDAPIIPAYLDQMWGSVFSFRGGRPFFKLPKELPYPVSVTYGEPLPGTTSAFKVRERIQELGAEAALRRRRESMLLHWGFLRRMRRRPWSRVVADENRKLSAVSLAAVSVALARKLQNREEGTLPILLPPSVAAVTANLGAMFAGVVPVNLNYTVGAEQLGKMCGKCGASRILTSRSVIDKLELKLELPLVYLEDLLQGLTLREKVIGLMRSLFFPLSLLEKVLPCGRKNSDSLATIIFSSGSTGDPKGVELTHGNISSNIEAIFDILQLEKRDRVVGVLPFFHSFGFTGTLWLPLLGGVRAVYHANPLDSKRIGELCHRHQGTLLFSTPTFLLSFIRRVEPEHFSSLRYVISGAEKLSEKIALSFEERFGVYPLEGYGATELSPVAVVNVPDYEGSSVKQKGLKPQTVGHPLPGIAVRIVDAGSYPDFSTASEAAKGPDEEGLLLIKGPNVMRGYLQDPERTAQVIRDGWYVTGDIARVDEDGFVTIVDRLSRFSKIGGEMVPHLKVEQAIQELLQERKLVGEGGEQACAVLGVPDEKKGEKLVVLHTVTLNPAEIIAGLRDRQLPNLWIPKADDFKMIPSLPMLGSGKADLKKMKELAAGQE